MRLLAIVLWAAVLIAAPTAAETLDVYVIDAGGKSSLFVSPSGESILFDVGGPGTVDRIVEVAKVAGVKKIDYVVVSHYDGDHVSGVPALAARIPVGAFMDHGANVQLGNPRYTANVDDYMALTAHATRVIVKAGDTIPVKGFEALVVMAGGTAIAAPLTGAGQPNPACDTTPRKTWGLDARGILDNHDTNENSQAIVLLITYGKFRMLDPADLTWNKDRELFCPMNRVGTVDVYMTANHGVENANSPVMVHAVRPRVAIADNPTSHGGTPDVFATVKASPGLEDYWQMNYQPAGGEKANVPPDFIANPAGSPGGKWIKISAERDGTFTVTNTRNNFARTYRPRVLGSRQPALAQTEIALMAPGSARAALDVLIPAFEQKTGHKIKSTGGNGLETKRRVVQGEAFDVDILQSPLQEVIASGNVVVGTETLLATMPMFVAVRKGATKPDISTPEAVKRLFLAAKGVSYPAAALGAGVGVSVDETLKTLGIFDQVRTKTQPVRTGGAAMALVAKGEVEIGLTFLNEITDPGVELVGFLPFEISPPTALVGFVSTHAKDPAAAKALLEYLSSPSAAAVYTERGYSPAR